MNLRASALSIAIFAILSSSVTAQSPKTSDSPNADRLTSEQEGNPRSVCPIGTPYKEVKKRLGFLKTEPQKLSKAGIRKLYDQNVLPWVGPTEKKEVMAWLETLSPTEEFYAHFQREKPMELLTWTIVYRGTVDNLRVADARTTSFCIF